MAHRLFFLLMAGSSALALIRAFVLAGLLSREDFGRYAILIAVAMFLSSIPALGLVEESRKLFPRLFVEGRPSEIRGRADHVTRILAVRIIMVGVVATLIAWVAISPWWGAATALLMMIAFGNGWCSVMASALRAGTSTLPLGITSFLRASMTLPLTVAAAMHFGLMGALCGEAVGALAGGAVMRASLQRLYPADGKDGSIYSHRASRAGLLVFFGGAFVSAPFYLNRPVAALAFSPAEVGTFGLLLVFVGALQAVTAICDQVIGPRLIHWQHGGMSMAQQKHRFFLVIAALAALSLAAFGVIWIGTKLPLAAPIADKYALTGAVLLPAAALAALNITSTADWMLQAHDRERIITIAAAENLAAFGVLTILVIAKSIGMETYIWGLAAAKLCQLGVQLAAIIRLPLVR